MKAHSNNLNTVSTLEDGTIVIKVIPSKILSEQPKEEASQEEDKIRQKDAAIYCGVSQQTLINWRKRGLIKVYRIGRPVHYKKSELDLAFKQSRGHK